MLGVLPGYTVQAVEAGYRDSRLSETAIDNLIPGKSVVYMRGWPVNQYDINGIPTAQQFKMTYVGQLETTASNGESLDVLVTAVPKADSKWDKDVCSFGASGSGGFVLVNGEPKLIGPLSVFWGFSDLYDETNSFYNPVGNLEYMKQTFPFIDWDNYSATCGFNFQAPKSTSVINIVPDTSDIPGIGNPVASAVYEAGLAFSNPRTEKAYINGTAMIEFPAQGGPSGDASLVINNPLIGTGQNGDVMIGYYGYPGTVQAVDVSLGGIVNIYPNSPDAPVTIDKSSPGLIYPSLSDSQYMYGGQGYVMDSRGLVMGNLLQKLPDINRSTSYKLNIVNGRFEIVAQS